MIDHFFLRRVEPNPSNDLPYLTNLFFYQFEASLSSTVWYSLLQPTTPQEELIIDQEHNRFIDFYSVHLQTLEPAELFSVVLPYTLKNRLIYNLCLIQRIRYENDWPPITFKENDWLRFTMYYSVPSLQSNFRRWLAEHIDNG